MREETACKVRPVGLYQTCALDGLDVAVQHGSDLHVSFSSASCLKEFLSDGANSDVCMFLINRLYHTVTRRACESK